MPTWCVMSVWIAKIITKLKKYLILKLCKLCRYDNFTETCFETEASKLIQEGDIAVIKTGDDHPYYLLKLTKDPYETMSFTTDGYGHEFPPLHHVLNFFLVWLTFWDFHPLWFFILFWGMPYFGYYRNLMGFGHTVIYALKDQLGRLCSLSRCRAFSALSFYEKKRKDGTPLESAFFVVFLYLMWYKGFCHAVTKFI